jgi:hypothetical protein
MKIRFTTLIALLGLVGTTVATAANVPVTFTQLTGLTGGTPAGTAVYRADLSGVGISTLLSLTILDNSGGLGGATGQFSGFDLDAVKLAYTSVADAASAAALAGQNVFDFTAGSIFTPGTQRAPADAKLFGTGPTGNTVDNVVATLGAFDANSTTAIPGAAGFLSMGDNGSLTLNLTAGLSTAGLFLYIGEVGDNGEVAAGTISVSDTRVPIAPDGGTTLGMLGLALAGLAWYRRKQA